MSKSESYDRFLELDAGRALGDLSGEEMKEWQELASHNQDAGSTGFDYLVSEMEIYHAQESILPASLSSKLIEAIPGSPPEDTQCSTSATLYYRFYLGLVGLLQHV